MNRAEKLEGIVLISKPTLEWLDEKQIVRYRERRKPYIEWLKTRGKDPAALKGFADDTASMYASITDKWARWLWERDGFTLNFTHDDASDYLEYQIIDQDHSRTHCSNVKLGMKTYFKWHSNREKWDPNIEIKSKSKPRNPQDFFTIDERRQLRNAAIEYGTVPAYAALDPEDRFQWKVYLSRRLDKPATDVGREDFNKANGYKYPTITFASLDAGLRPVEVGRAKTSWVNTQKAELSIPASEAAKNDQNWTVSIKEETAEFLARWLDEREMYEKYDDTDALWLTRHGNPYNSSSLKVLLDNLCKIAGIERDVSWYAIRHSVGTHLTQARDLNYAQSQLRHESKDTTMKYNHPSADDTRDALNDIG